MLSATVPPGSVDSFGGRIAVTETTQTAPDLFAAREPIFDATATDGTGHRLRQPFFVSAR